MLAEVRHDRAVELPVVGKHAVHHRHGREIALGVAVDLLAPEEGLGAW
jgi:hypothetical protein